MKKDVRDNLILAGFYAVTYSLVGVTFVVEGVYQATSQLKTFVAQKAIEHSDKMSEGKISKMMEQMMGTEPKGNVN